MDRHFAESVGRPDLIQLADGMFCLRFETMKVVSAMAAVQQLLDSGAIDRETTLLDSSSGIYAHALALAAHRHGLKCHIVGSTTVDETLRVQLAILGAHFEQMPPTPNLKLDQNRRVARIHEILRERPNYHWMRQYHDDIHYAGYRPIAHQIRRELGDTALTLVGGVGTGASTGSLATELRVDAPDTRLAGIQPFGSVTFDAEHLDDPDIIIAGIGSSIPFENVDPSLYDTVHWIGFGAAQSGAIELLRRHAVFAGLSTGAAFLAAQWEKERAPERAVVFTAPDTGHRYVQNVFARHQGAAAMAEFSPKAVADNADLALPWSYRDYDRPASGFVADGHSLCHAAAHT